MVELESEGELSRGAVAMFLRSFADELDGGVADRESVDVVDTDVGEPRTVTFVIGGDSATVSVPEVVEFEVEVESRSPMFGSSINQEVEFELSWDIEETDRTVEGDTLHVK